MGRYFSLLIAVLVAQPVAACINTSYSRVDESVITGALAPLILGAFPHHGRAFYEHETARTQKILKDAPANFVARNDLGAAYIKLEQWRQAQAEFEKNETLHPGLYETASNLGVMYKKKGDYRQAEKYISEALKIRPGGHMGLGNYYLKMIQWLGSATSSKGNTVSDAATNFLGIRYDSGPEAAALAANETHLRTLIKNDYQFADAYVVLGDILFTRRDYQLAFRAYVRAQCLPTATPNDYRAMLHKRMLAINKVWQKQKSFFQIVDIRGGRAQVRNEIGEAGLWLAAFQEIEEEFIALNRPTTFQDVLDEMDERGIHKPTIIEAGTYKGFAFNTNLMIPLLAVGLAVLLYLVSLRKRRKQNRRPEK